MYEVISIVFYCHLVVSVYNADVTIDTVTIYTVCYGSRSLPCTTHQLSCSDGLVIDIINTTYGFRSGCSIGTGVSNCINTTCCSEQASDCFLPFDPNHTKMITRECEGSQRCTSHGYRKSNVDCNGSRYSSYSRVEYVCKGTSGTTQSVYITGTSGSTQSVYIPGTGGTTQSTNTSTTDQIAKGTGSTQSRNNISTTDQKTRTKDTGAVVGGVVGVLVVAGVLLTVGFFIHKRKRMRKSDENNDTSKINVDSPQHQDPHYYTIGNLTRSSTNNTVDNDEVHLNGPPSKSPSGGNYDHIGEDNSTPSHHKQDNYNHIVSNGAVVLEDDYHHIRGVNSNELSNVDYNHIGSSSTVIRDNLRHQVTEDDYNHIGSTDNIISNECDYNHIGSTANIISDDCDYNHINGSGNHDEVREDDYNHINGSRIHDHVSEDDYNHIGGVMFPNHGVASTGDYELASLAETE